jgi:hypothetical protein
MLAKLSYERCLFFTNGFSLTLTFMRIGTPVKPEMFARLRPP